MNPLEKRSRKIVEEVLKIIFTESFLKSINDKTADYTDSMQYSEAYEIIKATLQKQEEEHFKLKEVIFVKHIENHIKEMGIKAYDSKVCCKICNKNIDVIYDNRIKELEKKE